MVGFGFRVKIEVCVDVPSVLEKGADGCVTAFHFLFDI